jgi:hypothetical protein
MYDYEKFLLSILAIYVILTGSVFYYHLNTDPQIS